MAISRRELLLTAGVAAVAIVAGRTGSARAATTTATDFAALPDGAGWPGWTTTGVANLRRDGGEGLLEAGSDVFPNEPRPVAFLVDRRFADGAITAELTRIGAGAGVVVRRVAPDAFYAAVVDTEQAALVLLRRSGHAIVELARTPVGPVALPARLTLAAQGTGPASLRATLVDATERTTTAAATDGDPRLQAAGDPGVLATARTLFPGDRVDAFPALGNTRLLPYGTQEGQAFIASPAGQPFVGAIRERSTAGFRAITLDTAEPPGVTVPSVVAASTGLEDGRPVLRVAADVPCAVELEVGTGPGLNGARRIDAGSTGAYDAVVAPLPDARAGERVHWRARLRRQGREAAGPVRSFRVPPAAGAREPVRLAVGACAAQFGPIFDRIAELEPDVLIWQGDLNYPDTHGPLAQTLSGYGGIWRAFLANPRTAALLHRTVFVGGRDDHDYGVQDANAETLSPVGLAPWDALLGAEPYGRFSAGLVDVWVLDQRRFKTPPDAPDTLDKTLLGLEQRAWLLRTLAASTAPFKLVCSPCTLAPARAENARDGNWSAGYTAERDLLLRHLDEQVAGTTLFVTGDTHFTMVYDDDRLFEARPCPLDIPTPNDITLIDPLAAEALRGRPGIVFADDEVGHVALVDVRSAGDTATLDLALVRPDGSRPYTRRFEARLPAEAASRERADAPARRTERGRRGRDRGAGSGSGSGGDTSPARASTGTRTSGTGDVGGDLPFTGSPTGIVALGGAALAAGGALVRRATRRRSAGDDAPPATDD